MLSVFLVCSFQCFHLLVVNVAATLWPCSNYSSNQIFFSFVNLTARFESNLQVAVDLMYYWLFRLSQYQHGCNLDLQKIRSGIVN